MPTITISEQFDCPPETAFEVLSDFEQAENFIEGIVSVRILTEGPVAVGTRFRETRIMLGRETEEEMEIVEFVPPERLRLYAFSRGTEYISTYLLTPNEEGTKVSLEFKGHPKTLMARVLSAVFSRMVGQVADMLQKDLREAKMEAERRHAS